MTNQPRKPNGYWSDRATLVQELLAFIEAHGTPGHMPSGQDMDRANRSDLRLAIERRQGGFVQIAADLQLKLPPSIDPLRNWHVWENVERELRSLLAAHGNPTTMLPLATIDAEGPRGLVAGLRLHGGLQEIAQRLGVAGPSPKRATGYWDDWANVVAELHAYIEAHGIPGHMPTSDELDRQGMSSLAAAIRKHGGFPAVAARLNLERHSDRKPLGFWNIWDNLARELTAFIDQYGTVGEMPTRPEFVAARRHDLWSALNKHGGIEAVANRLGLHYTRQPSTTQFQLAQARKLAQAVYPLVEARLLTGPHILIIARRLGLLEFNNERIGRLVEALASGKDEAISVALATIKHSSRSGTTTADDSLDEEPPTSTSQTARLTYGSSDGAPSVESVALKSIGALAELALDLDEVLLLITSKVLWSAYYARLYVWYQELPADQQVTPQDVAAYLDLALPQADDETLVTQSLSRFLSDVAAAITFAATLAQYGWHGPRLRLHQADAARRICDMLLGQSNQSFVLDTQDPGLGKTMAFLAAVCRAGCRRVAVVAPKTVANDTWSGPKSDIRWCLPSAHIVRGLEAGLVASAPPDQILFVILHYEELVQADALGWTDWFDTVCLDEITAVKHRGGQESQRRAALVPLLQRSLTTVGTTGTPLVNELIEPLSLLELLSSGTFDYDPTALRGQKLADVAHVYETVLPHMIRRRKAETLLDLPGATIQPTNIDLPLDLLPRVLGIHAWSSEHSSRALVELRRILVQAKLPWLLEQARLPSKLLIFTELVQGVSDRIADYLANNLPLGAVAHIHGQTPDGERSRLIESFRRADGPHVLVATFGTLSEGLTLFDAKAQTTHNRIIIADLPFTWAEMLQGIARLHRDGQRQEVIAMVPQVVTTLTLQDGSPLHSLDEVLWSLIVQKNMLSDMAIDGGLHESTNRANTQRALSRWLKRVRAVGIADGLGDTSDEEQAQTQDRTYAPTEQ